MGDEATRACIGRELLKDATLVTLTTLKQGREGRKGRIKRTNDNYEENHQNHSELAVPTGGTQETHVILFGKDANSPGYTPVF